MTTAVKRIQSCLNERKSDRQLTHTLGPKTDVVGVGRCPGGRKHGVKSAGKALQDAKTGDACGH